MFELFDLQMFLLEFGKIFSYSTFKNIAEIIWNTLINVFWLQTPYRKQHQITSRGDFDK